MLFMMSFSVVHQSVIRHYLFITMLSPSHYNAIPITRNERKVGHPIMYTDNGVFSKWNKTFTEFSEFREFRESEKSLRHELGLV